MTDEQRDDETRPHDLPDDQPTQAGQTQPGERNQDTPPSGYEIQDDQATQVGGQAPPPPPPPPPSPSPPHAAATSARAMKAPTSAKRLCRRTCPPQIVPAGHRTDPARR